MSLGHDVQMMTICTDSSRLYLWIYFETLELLFVVNSGVVSGVIQMYTVSITAQPGQEKHLIDTFFCFNEITETGDFNTISLYFWLIKPEPAMTVL